MAMIDGVGMCGEGFTPGARNCMLVLLDAYVTFCNSRWHQRSGRPATPAVGD